MTRCRNAFFLNRLSSISLMIFSFSYCLSFSSCGIYKIRPMASKCKKMFFWVTLSCSALIVGLVLFFVSGRLHFLFPTTKTPLLKLFINSCCYV
uniref:Putative product n=1 Tax=Xenopsylla cheopis TaxID=163159 RepID=A0A6M2DWF4_XENCH